MVENDLARGVFVVGLRNAHAMERQALSIMRPQVNRLVHYDALCDRLEAHIGETESQLARLDQVLERVGESSSAMKDMAQSTAGAMAAMGHAAAGDEVLKNAFANLAFENYEIGAYTSLITAAKACGEHDAATLLQQSLDEERRMSDWVVDNIPSVTERYMSLQGSGESAKT